jgi:integrase
VSLYKRPESKYWWCKVTVGGETIRRSSSTTSKSKARLFEDRLREQLWELKKLGKVAYTWDLAAEKWLEEAVNKRSLSSDEGILAWLQPRLTRKRLVEIDRALVDDLRAEKLKDASQSTVNRHMALLRAVLKKARDEWEWIGQIPSVPMYSIEKHEPRWIAHAEFEKLAKALPPYLERLARFAVLTGLRRTSLITLTWGQVDLKRKHVWIAALRSKSKKPIAVPLSPAAVRVLRTVKPAKPEPSAPVFSYAGGPISGQNGYVWKQWRLAVKAAGLEPFRFHDLRHTWASWHIQAGTPPHILQELGAWSSYEMVRVYAHLNADHLAEWASNLGHRKKRPARK